jgi:hypothetical protein
VIILDTNQLERSQPPDGPLIAMLQALGRQTGHQLRLPELVFEEHLAHYRRDVEGASARSQKAESDLIKLIPDLHRQEQLLPDVDRAVEDRSQRLQRVFQIRPTPDEAAREALLREARRKPPAKTSQEGQGSGARDVAIWLTAISACEESKENTYFVATDINAFGKENLKPELVEELELRLGTDANMFHYCYGLDVLLSQLAAGPGRDVSFDRVVNDVRVKAAVASSLFDHAVTSQLISSAGLLPGVGTVTAIIPGLSIQAINRPTDTVLAYRVGETTWASARPSWLATRRFMVEPGRWDDRYAVELTFSITTTAIMQINDAGNIVNAEVTGRSGASQIRGVGVNRDIALHGVQLEEGDEEATPPEPITESDDDILDLNSEDDS